jgi:hypothetical protein
MTNGDVSSVEEDLEALMRQALSETTLKIQWDHGNDAVSEEDDLEGLPVNEHPEHITSLLLSPSLRSVDFDQFYFPNSVCQAIALALKTRSPITRLNLYACNFSDGGGGSIMHSLQGNTTLKTLSLVHNELDGSFSDALRRLLSLSILL